MRNLFMVALVFVLLAGIEGCAGLAFPASQSTVGWSFYIGRPATVVTQSPAIINQTNGPTGIQSMGSLNGVSPSIIHTPVPQMPAAPVTGRTQLFTVPACAPQASPPCQQPCGPCAPQE